ncbi:autophagy-related protein 18h-like isoform X2 [Hibiscus syriacus]|uniref:autophagy-related protein 18h-like isoform X2 n=1 Tax=Hibiscus syriacus TaxID=106335 RepID=UPI001921388F|nr:autophagy-related protein 18h-like isoform X2 [Hibiscus syriacus]
MKRNGNIGNNKGSNIGNNNRFLPNSLKFISSCLKTASSGVRSASASVAASVTGGSQEHPRDQLQWASFDRLELAPLSFKRVLLLGYFNGFQVLDVEDASNVSELVSRRDDPATFLQMQPLPEMSEGHEGFRASHPLLLVVADESKVSGLMLTRRDGFEEPKNGNTLLSPTVVRFYSLRSHNYVHVLRFRSTVYMVRCSPRIVAVGLATQVVVKDFVSRAVVSQFRAHSSPISALCFDPSGTLLVTASIHGNNINIFRIMPSSTKIGSGTQSNDWSSSHVHLYKLHRGMTSAVIQDICFSAFSQWIAIVSSRGTGHIFVLSPFGAENVLQIRNSLVDGPILSPVVSFPWWSTPSFLRNYQTFSLPAPPTITLSVVSRIKSVNSGWLNTVTNAASSTAGRTSFPSGAFSAIFHNSLPNDTQRTQVDANVLEHLLVYTPSGHVVQHKLLPSFGGEASESASRIGPDSALQVPEEGLRVKVEPMQAWDVCRRTDWPEREECVSGMTYGRKEPLEVAMDGSDSEENNAGQKDLSKPQDLAHLYLSNAEVQISSGRVPIWQNSKVSFYAMSPVRFNEHKFTADQSGGEIEIERMPAHEVEIRQRDLLPIFEHFHRIQPDWNDRGLAAESYPMSSSHDAKARFSEVTVISHSKLVSPGSTENSDNGSSRNSYPPSIQYGKDSSGIEGQSSILTSDMLNQSSLSKDAGLAPFGQSKMGVCHIEDNKSSNSPSSLTSDSLSGGRNSGGSSDVSNTSSNRSDLSLNMLDEGPVNESPDFEHFFREEYCKVLPSSACVEPSELPTDVDSNSSPCEREKSEEGDNDDMFGGIFSFSEDG